MRRSPLPSIPNAVRREAASLRLLMALTLCAVLACAWSVRSWRHLASIRGPLDRAEAAARAGRSAEAIEAWRAALQLDPKNPRIYEMMIQYCLTTGQWAQAEQTLQALQRELPQTRHVFCRIAACRLRLNEQQLAFDTANEELKHDPNCVAALGLITAAMALQTSPDKKLYLEYLTRLSRLAPNDLDFQHMYAEALTNGYQYDELRPVVAQILKIAPRDAEAYNLLGYADLASPHQPAGVEQARKDFETSLALNPANGGAHYGLGRVALRQGAWKEAVAELEQALRMRPEAMRINFELSQAYRMAGMPKQAEAASARYIKWQSVATKKRQLEVRCLVYPEDPRYPRELGLLLLDNRGDPAEARYYLQRAQQLAPGDPKVEQALRRTEPASPPESSAPVSSIPFRPEQAASASPIPYR